MKIYALMENMPYDDAFAGEHGLSLYIETESRSILLTADSLRDLLKMRKNLELISEKSIS